MRKIILAFFVALFSQVALLAQPCSPNPAIGSDMMHPAELPFAMVGYDYEQVLTFRVPKDSVIEYNGNNIPATVDSARVLFVGGIPSGFTLVCNPASCTWKGGSLGCAKLYGRTDSAAMEGSYPIKIYVMSWIKIGTTAIERIDSSSSYTFKIRAYNGGIKLEKTQPLKVYPNPAQSRINIELQDVQSDDNFIEIMDLNGRVVYRKDFKRPSDFVYNIDVNTEAFAKSLYIVRLQSGEKLFTGKVAVE